MKAEHGITDKQERFCQEYLIDLNATQAAIRAGYSAEKGAGQFARRLMENPRIQARISALKRQTHMATLITREMVLKEIARIAFFDIRKLVDADGKPKRLHELDADTAAALSGLDIAKIGNTVTGEGEVLKFKVSDKNAALEKLAKHLGLFELDNSQSQPKITNTIDVSQLSTDALAEIMKAKKKC